MRCVPSCDSEPPQPYFRKSRAYAVPLEQAAAGTRLPAPLLRLTSGIDCAMTASVRQSANTRNHWFHSTNQLLSIFSLGEQVARQAVQGNSLDGFFLMHVNDMADTKGPFVTDQPSPPPSNLQPEPMFFLAPVVTNIMAVCAGLFVLQSYVLGVEANHMLAMHMAFIPARYSADISPLDLGFLISPVGYSLLHASLAHLTINMIWLAAFGSPLAARFGAPRFLLFWAATAVGAALLHFLSYSASTVPMVGASGSISGMMGAAARFSFRTSQGRGVRSFAGAPLSIGGSLTNRTVLTFVGIWMAVNLITGLGWSSGPANASGIAWEAHIGGFLVGFLCLSVFDRQMPPRS